MKAILTGSDTCTAEGITVRARTPVLELCRKLVAAGHDPGEPMEVYRGQTLALLVRSIGEGAKLTVDESEGQTPRFRKWSPRPTIGGKQGV